MLALLKSCLRRPSLARRTIATLLCEQAELFGSSSKSNFPDNPPLLRSGQQLGIADFSILLQKCGNTRSLTQAKHIHAQIRRSGLEKNKFLGNRLIWTYDKCGSPKDARKAFDTLIRKETISWNMMIASYASNGCAEDAHQLFESMQKECIKSDKVTFLNILTACNNHSDWNKGRLIHACIVFNLTDIDIILKTALVNMYGRCGSIDDAHSMFTTIPKPNVIPWTAMISGYALQGLSKEVMKLFHEMQQAGVRWNNITFVTMLNSCAGPHALPDGRLFHAYIVEKKPDPGKILGTAFVSMYSRCGSLDDARYVFTELPTKHDVVLWTAMITAYTDYDCAKEALGLFQQMPSYGLKPNKVTFTCVFDATANEAWFLDGKLLHWHVLEECYESDLVVSNSILNMYSKCGSSRDAHAVFNGMKEHDLISWNALISSYTQHGHGKVVIRLFQQMKQERVKPDKITFISVLSACSRSGLVDEACYYFTLMQGEFKVKPNQEHYRCMADLLGRVGRVKEAEELVRDMPYVPGAMAWSSLLGACKVHSNLEQGKDAADHVLEFNPQDIAAFNMLYN